MCSLGLDVVSGSVLTGFAIVLSIGSGLLWDISIDAALVSDGGLLAVAADFVRLCRRCE